MGIPTIRALLLGVYVGGPLILENSHTRKPKPQQTPCKPPRDLLLGPPTGEGVEAKLRNRGFQLVCKPSEVYFKGLPGDLTGLQVLWGSLEGPKGGSRRISEGSTRCWRFLRVFEACLEIDMVLLAALMVPASNFTGRKYPPFSLLISKVNAE